MLHRSCGNSGIMPVVLWPWPGGQFLGPEGCCSSCLCKLGVLGSVLDWKDEQLEGWRPVGASRGHRGHSHSKPWLPAQRYGVKEDHASGAEKELLFPPWLTKDTAMQPAKQTLPNNNPIVLLSCDYIFCVPMHGNRNYYICAAA